MKTFVVDKLSGVSKHCESQKCPCPEFQDQFMGLCRCGLYRKTPADYIIFTEEGLDEGEILKKAIRRAGKVYVTSDEYDEKPEGVAILPLLMIPSGAILKFEEALGYIQGEHHPLHKRKRE